jgi:hypothetical protein
MQVRTTPGFKAVSLVATHQLGPTERRFAGPGVGADFAAGVR